MIDFTKYRRRICQTLHTCAVCRKDISLRQEYYDGGYGRRAHVVCVSAAAERRPPLPKYVAMVLMDNGTHGPYWTPCFGSVEHRELDRHELEVVQYERIGHCLDCAHCINDKLNARRYCKKRKDGAVYEDVPPDGSGFCYKFEEKS